jgi:DNA-directed RNA polymerase subunit RPC12/RpoP
MRVLRAWSTEIVCENCGYRLEIDVNDIKVRLVGNYGQTGNLTADKIPEYITKCGKCGYKIILQSGFSGKLPEKVKATAEKSSKVDLNRIHHDI